MMARDGDSGIQLHPDVSGPADASHPGLFLRREIVAGRGLSVSEAAPSPEMALRCEKAFGLAMETLIRMQCAHDSALMRARTHEVDVPPFVPRPKPGQGSLL